MKNIKDLLDSVPNFKEPQKDKKIVADIIENVCGLQIETKKIDFISGSNKNSSGDSLRLNISHIEKTVIFMNQSAILAQIKAKVPNRKIGKIG